MDSPVLKSSSANPPEGSVGSDFDEDATNTTTSAAP